MLRYMSILKHSWNKRPSYLHGARTFMHTKEKDVFLNDLKVSLAPTPQEGSFHVMFVETTHTQEQNKPNVCDWNHLSLSVTVPAKLVFEVQSGRTARLSSERRRNG